MLVHQHSILQVVVFIHPPTNFYLEQGLPIQPILKLVHMCVAPRSIPASVPPPALVGGGARLGDWTAVPLSAGSLGVGRGVRTQHAPLSSKMLGPLHSNQPGFCGRAGPGWRGSARAWQAKASEPGARGFQKPPSRPGWKLFFKWNNPQPLSWRSGLGCRYPETLVPVVPWPQLLGDPEGEGSPHRNHSGKGRPWAAQQGRVGASMYISVQFFRSIRPLRVDSASSFA